MAVGVDAPTADPDLEVQVRPYGVAAVADEAQALAGADRLARHDGDRVLLAVGEEEVATVRGVLDDVVARAAGLVVDVGDRPCERRDDGGALRGDDVLAFVQVALALGADAVAVDVPALDREDAAVGRRRRRSGRCGRAVMHAVHDEPPAPHAAQPAHAHPNAPAAGLQPRQPDAHAPPGPDHLGDEVRRVTAAQPHRHPHAPRPLAIDPEQHPPPLDSEAAHVRALEASAGALSMSVDMATATATRICRWSAPHRTDCSAFVRLAQVWATESVAWLLGPRTGSAGPENRNYPG